MLGDHKNWRECVKLAASYIATDQRDIWLSWNDADRPWQYVTDVKGGGGYRLEVSTSVNLRADHPSGLSFQWSEDIEKHEANGRGFYQIDMDMVRMILSSLPGPARQGFRDYLRDFASALLKNATTYREIADREFAEAATLGDLAGFIPELPAAESKVRK